MTREMGAALRRIQLGSALSAFGLGFTVPYLYVYVAQVRDLRGGGSWRLRDGGAGLCRSPDGPSTGGACPCWWWPPVWLAPPPGIRGSPGRRAGRRGPGRGYRRHAPALATMLVWCSTATRTRAFAVQFFLQNLGLGLGGLVGGQLVDVDRPASFTLFLIEAAMFVVLGVMTTVRMPRPASLGEVRPPTPRRQGGGLRARRTGWCSCACSGSAAPATGGLARARAAGRPARPRAGRQHRGHRVQFVVLGSWVGAPRAVGLLGVRLDRGAGGWATAARPWRRPRSSPRTRCSGWVRRCCRRPSRRWSRTWRRSRWSGSTTRRSPCASSSRWRSARRSAGPWGPRCTARTS
ncbi:hypothetical protein SCALM49S_07261 [Streptomyces californicus]